MIAMRNHSSESFFIVAIKFNPYAESILLIV
jgi:hypothetical protein